VLLYAIRTTNPQQKAAEFHLDIGIVVSPDEITRDMRYVSSHHVDLLYHGINSFLISLATNISLDGREDLDFSS
jgi:hypothetical protein